MAEQGQTRPPKELPISRTEQESCLLGFEARVLRDGLRGPARLACKCEQMGAASVGSASTYNPAGHMTTERVFRDNGSSLGQGTEMSGAPWSQLRLDKGNLHQIA